MPPSRPDRAATSRRAIGTPAIGVTGRRSACRLRVRRCGGRASTVRRPVPRRPPPAAGWSPPGSLAKRTSQPRSEKSGGPTESRRQQHPVRHVPPAVAAARRRFAAGRGGPSPPRPSRAAASSRDADRCHRTGLETGRAADPQAMAALRQGPPTGLAGAPAAGFLAGLPDGVAPQDANGRTMALPPAPGMPVQPFPAAGRATRATGSAPPATGSPPRRGRASATIRARGGPATRRPVGEPGAAGRAVRRVSGRPGPPSPAGSARR
jgi:hypothetical protein